MSPTRLHSFSLWAGTKWIMRSSFTGSSRRGSGAPLARGAKKWRGGFVTWLDPVLFAFAAWSEPEAGAILVSGVGLYLDGRLRGGIVRPFFGSGPKLLRTYLDFEKSVADVEAKIEELAAISEASGSEALAMGAELARLKVKAEKQLSDIYSKLDPWQKTQVARHADRPRYQDYVGALVTDYVELSGDRSFGEDAAILGGTGNFLGRPVLAMGHEKGRIDSRSLEAQFRHGAA
ncbi:MAG: hypothetical protein R3C27_02030 [Hyphomonadaceae bacterium]